MIITPQQLWKDYDRKMLKLSVSPVSSRKEGGAETRYFYFNGESAPAGCTRVFAKLSIPEGGAKFAVLVMDDTENGIDAFDNTPYLEKGWAVMVCDYAGEGNGKERFTIYPAAFSFARYFDNPEYVYDFSENPKLSCWFIWATVALRSVTFLEQEGFLKIAMLGVGNGGAQVIKALFFPGTLAGGAVLFSSDFPKVSEGKKDNAYLAFKASLDTQSYGPYIKAPLFMQATSNEQNSSLDYMDEIYSTAQNAGALFSISERCDRTLNTAQRRNIELFFENIFLNTPLPAAPVLTSKGSGKSLYFEYKTPDPSKIESVRLYVAHSQKIAAYRNWREHTIEKVGPDEYLAKVPVYAAKELCYGFVNISYSSGFNISSQIVHAVPESLGVQPVNFTQKRRVYDNEMGPSEWMVLTSGDESGSLYMKEGPFGITGVTSSVQKLSTFILADKQYKGPQGAVLQLIIYSSAVQSLTFAVTLSPCFNKYICFKNISPHDNWLKISLSQSDFRSIEGTLNSWDDIVTFEIWGTEEFLVSSMLWV